MSTAAVARTARRVGAQGETIILLGDDGRHVLLGRHGEPDEGEMARIAGLLAAKGQGGWVLRMRGDYWHRQRRVRLEMVRQVAPTATAFDTAAAAFEARRQGQTTT